MCLIGPVVMLRPPPGTSSQTQPDGRSVYSVFLLGQASQWGIAPLCACPLDEPRRQVEIAERHVPHAAGVQQRHRVLPEHRPEGARGRREAKRAAGLGVHVRHGQRQVRHDQTEGRGVHVEDDPRAEIARGMRQEGRGWWRTSWSRCNSERPRGRCATGSPRRWPTRNSRPITGAGSGRTTGSSASIARSGGGRGSSEPSRTATRSSCWSLRD